MQKLTDLTKEELIELIVREREALSGWQPIESAPKDGTFVLINEMYSESPVVAQFESGRWWVRADYFESYGDYTMVDKESEGYFTHWQPLPTPPTEIE